MGGIINAQGVPHDYSSAMSMKTLQDIQAALTNAGNAQAGMIDAMAEFQSACIIGNWDRTEAARAKAKDFLDAFFDHMATAHRR